MKTKILKLAFLISVISVFVFASTTFAFASSDTGEGETVTLDCSVDPSITFQKVIEEAAKENVTTVNVKNLQDTVKTWDRRFEDKQLKNVTVNFYDCVISVQTFMTCPKGNVLFNFENCVFNGNFQHQSHPDKDKNDTNIDFHFTNCQFSGDYYYQGDGIGDLIYVNCKNIGRINATGIEIYNNAESNTKYKNSNGGPSILSITNCTFTDTVTAYANPDKTREGLAILTWGSGFSSYVFNGNTWSSDGSKVYVDVYDTNWNGRPSDKYQDNILSYITNWNLNNSYQHDGMLTIVAKKVQKNYSATADYYRLENGTYKKVNETPVELPFSGVAESGDLVKISPEEFKLYKGTTYTAAPDLSVEGLLPFVSEMEMGAEDIVLHLNFVYEVPKEDPKPAPTPAPTPAPQPTPTPQPQPTPAPVDPAPPTLVPVDPEPEKELEEEPPVEPEEEEEKTVILINDNDVPSNVVIELTGEPAHVEISDTNIPAANHVADSILVLDGDGEENHRCCILHFLLGIVLFILIILFMIDMRHQQKKLYELKEELGKKQKELGLEITVLDNRKAGK